MCLVLSLFIFFTGNTLRASNGFLLPTMKLRIIGLGASQEIDGLEDLDKKKNYEKVVLTIDSYSYAINFFTCKELGLDYTFKTKEPTKYEQANSAHAFIQLNNHSMLLYSPGKGKNFNTLTILTNHKQYTFIIVAIDLYDAQTDSWKEVQKLKTENSNEDYFLSIMNKWKSKLSEN